MAHLAKLGGLTEELVTLLTSVTSTSDRAKFNVYRETSLRKLRVVHPRTNQFDIASQLEGLEEKFRVFNEDPLADALRERLDTLNAKKLKWSPEILHLLLELSDKPVSKSRLEHLENLKEPEADTGPPLRWKDLVGEDPLLREKKIWENVDFGAGSSDDDDDGFDDGGSEVSIVSEATVLSSVDDGYNRPPQEYTLRTLNEDALKELRKAQFWTKTPNINGVVLETVKKPISELQAIREVLFMFSGYPTSLFQADIANPKLIVACRSYALKHVSYDAFQKQIQDFAVLGSAIITLRNWSKQSQSTPLTQVLQGCITERVFRLDKTLCEIEQRFVDSNGDVIVSLLSVQAELMSVLRPLVRLSDITNWLDDEPYAHAFRHLEMLYDQACVSQMAGDEKMYAFLGTIFFECFHVYLRPMRAWMEEGELSKDDKVFFISEIAGEVEPASLWASRFKMRKTQNGNLHAPKFLQPSASKIFTTGKSVVVLKKLNKFASMQSPKTKLEPRLDFESVCSSSELEFAPFSELFDTSFNVWMHSKHHYTSSILRKTLFDSCGLHISLDALSHIYFLADGIVGANFTNAIFDKLDTLDTSWNDRFTLTELAQSTLGSLPCVSTEHLKINVILLPRKYRDVSTCRRSVKTLATIELNYRLSWPIQTIITRATIPSYQRIFTFLLQIRRSTHILSRHRLIKSFQAFGSATDELALYYSLRTRLLWFTQTLYYYLTALVIEPNTRAMQANLKDAEDVDTMIAVHETFIRKTVDQALLGKKLELILKTVLKLLDQGIKLEDLHAAHTAASIEAQNEHDEMIDISIASLGLHSIRNASKPSKFAQSTSRPAEEEDSDEEVDVDLSILSSNYDDGDDTYVNQLRKLKGEFDRLVRFVASGLRGVARAGAGEEGRSWDILGEMLESGLGSNGAGWR